MLTKEGYRLIYSRLTDFEPSHFVYNDIIKHHSMVVDMLLYKEGTAKGHVIVVDMYGFNFAHTGRLNPLAIKNFLYYLQEAVPIRLKSLHFINTNAVMDIVFTMMKPFLKKELMEVVRTAETFYTKHTIFFIIPSFVERITIFCFSINFQNDFFLTEISFDTRLSRN